MTFGLVKSIIEESLIQSYKDEKTFKKSLSEFKHNILNNKEISKVYSLYDDLSKPSGLSEQDAREFVTEGVTLIQNLLSKIKLPKIIGESKVQNKYQDIDNLVYTSAKSDLKERIESKKKIYNILTESEKKQQTSFSIPISTMVKVANQTVQNYIENLDEQSKKELFEIIKEDTEKLEGKYNFIKESAIEKLTPLVESQEDNDTKTKLLETIEKIKKDSFSQLNFLKLKRLEQSL